MEESSGTGLAWDIEGVNKWGIKSNNFDEEGGGRKNPLKTSASCANSGCLEVRVGGRGMLVQEPFPRYDTRYAGR